MLVDEAIAGDAARFEAMGDRELVGALLDLAVPVRPGRPSSSAAVARRPTDTRRSVRPPTR